MKLERIKEIINSIVQKSIDNLENYLYYENNKYKYQYNYCGQEPYSYEEDIYYYVRKEIDHSFSSLTIDIIRTCLKEEYRFDDDFYSERWSLVNENKGIPFDFIIERKIDSMRVGYGLKICGEEIVGIENVLADINHLNLSNIVGLQLWESENMTSIIQRNNKIFNDSNLQYSNLYMRDFFEECIGESIFDYYIDQVKRFYEEANKNSSIKVIPILSPMYMPRFRDRVEKGILEIEYSDVRYEFIKDSSDNEYMAWKRKNVKEKTVKNVEKIKQKYEYEKNYKLILGDKSFAKTFMTSEWLFYSINDNGEFDYTSIVTGYLKSIEQLLYYLMQLEINNNKYAAIKFNYLERVKEITDGALFEESDDSNEGFRRIDLEEYEIKQEKNKIYKVHKVTKNKEPLRNIWVSYNTNTSEFICDAMGDYLYFIKRQSDIVDRKNKWLICDVIDCFRDECRNGFFHTHIIDSWDIVKKIRSNALYIYFLVLGSLTINICKSQYKNVGKMEYKNVGFSTYSSAV